MCGPSWALPPRFLRSTAAAAGIASINSFGNLGGFAGPYVIGAIRDRTGSFAAALLGGALLMAIAGVLAVALALFHRGMARRARPAVPVSQVE
jgi:ACS family tartrate transporter-like MFS transporter